MRCTMYQWTVEVSFVIQRGVKTKKTCHLHKLFVRSEAWQDVSPPFKAPLHLQVIATICSYCSYNCIAIAKQFAL